MQFQCTTGQMYHTKVAQFSEKCACSEWSNTSAFFAHTAIEWLGSDGSRSEWACARARCTIIMVGKMSFVSVEAINTMRSSNCWCLNKCAKPTRFIASIKCKFFVVVQCKNKDFFPNLKIEWIFKHNYTINVSWNYHKHVIYRLNILSLPKIWLSDSIITLATDWWPKRMTTFFKTPNKKDLLLHLSQWIYNQN